MTTESMTPAPILEEETVKRPGKAWRNLWRAKVASFANDEWLEAGDERLGERVYPSAELAEHAALTESQALNPPNFFDRYEYLGPVELPHAD